MAHDFLIFDFGDDEETAQQARRKVENWIQGYRLGKKIVLKYEREDASAVEHDGEEASSAKPASSKKKSSKSADAANVRVLIRLDFTGHEKLSHQRWLDRIPTEEPFKSAKHEIQNENDEGYDKAQELFDSLD